MYVFGGLWCVWVGCGDSFFVGVLVVWVGLFWDGFGLCCFVAYDWLLWLRMFCLFGWFFVFGGFGLWFTCLVV